PFAWRPDESFLFILFFIGAVGGLLLVIAEAHSDSSPFAIPYRLYGVLLALGTLIPLSYGRLAADFGNRGQESFGFLLQTLAVAFWLMTVGLREDRGLPFTAGVLYFLLWAMLRYIDLFGGNMLGAACMFFLCALVIASVALFWHRRKKEALHD